MEQQVISAEEANIAGIELKEYNPDNCQSQRSGKPKLSLNSKSGVIVFNKALCQQLNIEHGSKVLFHQNTKDKTSWYLQVTDKGFELRGKNGQSLAFNSTKLVRDIFESNKVDMTEKHTGSCLVSKTRVSNGDIQLWPIITHPLKED